MTRRSALWTGLAISLVVLAGMFRLGDMGALIADLRDLHAGLVLLGLGVLGLNYWLRTWRFRLLLGSKNRGKIGLFGIVCLSATLNYLLPARLGELSLPLLLKRFSGQQYSVGTASLIAARVLDLFAVAALFPAALLASQAVLPAWVAQAALAVMTATVAGIAALLWFLRTRSLSETASTGSAIGWMSRLWVFALGVLDHLSGMARRGALLPLVALSVGIWLCIAVNFYLILAAAGLDVPFFAAFVTTAVMIPLSFIPAQGFANLGTHEAAWLAVLVAMGFPMETAARATLLSHVMLLGYVLVMGVIGWTVTLSIQARESNAG